MKSGEESYAGVHLPDPWQGLSLGALVRCYPSPFIASVITMEIWVNKIHVIAFCTSWSSEGTRAHHRRWGPYWSRASHWSLGFPSGGISDLACSLLDFLCGLYTLAVESNRREASVVEYKFVYYDSKQVRNFYNFFLKTNMNIKIIHAIITRDKIYILFRMH